MFKAQRGLKICYKVEDKILSQRFKTIEDFLQTAVPDKFVFRKSISKICDSYRVGKEDKKRLRAMAAKRLKFFP